MGNRGFTLIDLLVAAVLGAIILLAMGSLYVFSIRQSQQGFSQSYLQDRGALVLEEMARQIRPASALNTGCQIGNPNSLKVTNSNGDYCFYRDDTGALREIRPGGGAPGADLLSGTPAPIQATSFAPTLLDSNRRATVTFQLRWTDPHSGDNSLTMTFATDISRRN